TFSRDEAKDSLCPSRVASPFPASRAEAAYARAVACEAAAAYEQDNAAAYELDNASRAWTPMRSEVQQDLGLHAVPELGQETLQELKVEEPTAAAPAEEPTEAAEMPVAEPELEEARFRLESEADAAFALAEAASVAREVTAAYVLGVVSRAFQSLSELEHPVPEIGQETLKELKVEKRTAAAPAEEPTEEKQLKQLPTLSLWEGSKLCEAEISLPASPMSSARSQGSSALFGVLCKELVGSLVINEAAEQPPRQSLTQQSSSSFSVAVFDTETKVNKVILSPEVEQAESQASQAEAEVRLQHPALLSLLGGDSRPAFREGPAPRVPSGRALSSSPFSLANSSSQVFSTHSAATSLFGLGFDVVERLICQTTTLEDRSSEASEASEIISEHGGSEALSGAMLGSLLPEFGALARPKSVASEVGTMAPEEAFADAVELEDERWEQRDVLAASLVHLDRLLLPPGAPGGTASPAVSKAMSEATMVPEEAAAAAAQASEELLSVLNVLSASLRPALKPESDAETVSLEEALEEEGERQGQRAVLAASLKESLAPPAVFSKAESEAATVTPQEAFSAAAEMEDERLQQKDVLAASLVKLLVNGLEPPAAPSRTLSDTTNLPEDLAVTLTLLQALVPGDDEPSSKPASEVGTIAPEEAFAAAEGLFATADAEMLREVADTLEPPAAPSRAFSDTTNLPEDLFATLTLRQALLPSSRPASEVGTIAPEEALAAAEAVNERWERHAVLAASLTRPDTLLGSLELTLSRPSSAALSDGHLSSEASDSSEEFRRGVSGALIDTVLSWASNADSKKAPSSLASHVVDLDSSDKDSVSELVPQLMKSMWQEADEQVTEEQFKAVPAGCSPAASRAFSSCTVDSATLGSGFAAEVMATACLQEVALCVGLDDPARSVASHVSSKGESALPPSLLAELGFPVDLAAALGTAAPRRLGAPSSDVASADSEDLQLRSIGGNVVNKLVGELLLSGLADSADGSVVQSATDRQDIVSARSNDSEDVQIRSIGGKVINRLVGEVLQSECGEGSDGSVIRELALSEASRPVSRESRGGPESVFTFASFEQDLLDAAAGSNAFWKVAASAPSSRPLSGSCIRSGYSPAVTGPASACTDWSWEERMLDAATGLHDNDAVMEFILQTPFAQTLAKEKLQRLGAAIPARDHSKAASLADEVASPSKNRGPAASSLLIANAEASNSEGLHLDDGSASVVQVLLSAEHSKDASLASEMESLKLSSGLANSIFNEAMESIRAKDGQESSVVSEASSVPPRHDVTQRIVEELLGRKESETAPCDISAASQSAFSFGLPHDLATGTLDRALACLSVTEAPSAQDLTAGSDVASEKLPDGLSMRIFDGALACQSNSAAAPNDLSVVSDSIASGGKLSEGFAQRIFDSAFEDLAAAGRARTPTDSIVSEEGSGVQLPGDYTQELFEQAMEALSGPGNGLSTTVSVVSVSTFQAEVLVASLVNEVALTPDVASLVSEVASTPDVLTPVDNGGSMLACPITPDGSEVELDADALSKRPAPPEARRTQAGKVGEEDGDMTFRSAPSFHGPPPAAGRKQIQEEEEEETTLRSAPPPAVGRRQTQEGENDEETTFRSAPSVPGPPPAVGRKQIQEEEQDEDTTFRSAPHSHGPPPAVGRRQVEEDPDPAGKPALKSAPLLLDLALSELPLGCAASAESVRTDARERVVDAVLSRSQKPPAQIPGEGGVWIAGLEGLEGGKSQTKLAKSPPRRHVFEQSLGEDDGRPVRSPSGGGAAAATAARRLAAQSITSMLRNTQKENEEMKASLHKKFYSPAPGTKLQTTPSLPLIPLDKEKASLETKRAVRLVYHRVLSPPPAYRKYSEKSAMDLDCQDEKDPKLHFDAALMEKRFLQQRATYQALPGAVPLTRKEVGAVSPPQKSGQKGKISTRSKSTPLLPPASRAGTPPGTAGERRPPKLRPLPKGCEMLKMLADGKLPSLLCPPC
ncbi:unnamed protein product, partial [Polarella glacialis]